jgi:hypothetical protein
LCVYKEEASIEWGELKRGEGEGVSKEKGVEDRRLMVNPMTMTLTILALTMHCPSHQLEYCTLQ